MEDGEFPDGKDFSKGEGEYPFIAHKSEDGAREEPILEHLLKTARLAREFAGVFGAGDLGELAAMGHDTVSYTHLDVYKRQLYGGL